MCTHKKNQPTFVEDSKTDHSLQRNSRIGGHKYFADQGFETNTSSQSQDDDAEHVLYSGVQNTNGFWLPDLDLMDLPISGNSVCMGGSVNAQNNLEHKIYATKHKGSRLVITRCCFCQQRLCQGDLVVQLPCSHFLHFACIKKWTIISNPCKKCDQK